MIDALPMDYSGIRKAIGGGIHRFQVATATAHRCRSLLAVGRFASSVRISAVVRQIFEVFIKRSGSSTYPKLYPLNR